MRIAVFVVLAVIAGLIIVKVIFGGISETTKQIEERKIAAEKAKIEAQAKENAERNKPVELTPEQKAAEEKKLADAKEAELKAKEQKVAEEKAALEKKTAEDAKAKEELQAKEQAGKARLKTIQSHLENIDGIQLDVAALDPAIKQRALSSKASLNSASKKLDIATAAAAQMNSKINAEKSAPEKESDKIKTGFRWVGSDVVHPISSLPSNRHKPVKYIYAEESKKDLRIKELQKQLAPLQAAYNSAKAELDKAQANYTKVVSDYKTWLTNEANQLKLAVK